MKSMQRRFGGFMKRSDDEADVGAVLANFRAVDETLGLLVKDLKAYRDAWDDVLRRQYDCSEAFADLYKPIAALEKPGEEPSRRPEPTVTPQRYLHKCLGLQKLHSEAKSELAHEVSLIETKLLRPVDEATRSLKGLHKTLKHRDNTKLDYERYLKRAEHARQKENRSAKDELALQSHENHLAQARIDYQTADDQVMQTFPPVTDAILALMPQLLASQIMLQTTLVGQLYTVLDTYTRTHQMPNPAPSDPEIIDAWDREFTGFRRELEQGISVIAQGKAVHQPMTLPEKSEGGTITGLGIRNKVMNRKASDPASSKLSSVMSRPRIGSRQDTGHLSAATGVEEEEEAAPPKPPRPGAGGVDSAGMGMGGYSPSPKIPTASKPRIPSPQPPAPYEQKSAATMPSWPNNNNPPPAYDAAYGGTASPAALASPAPDYFAGRRHPSEPSIASSPRSALASSAAAMAAGKKKPPPPVPAKRLPNEQNAQFVTAIYDFEGQNDGDLAFREGDRIRVVKRTGSQDDWWDGEVHGRVGVFPANYVQL